MSQGGTLNNSGSNPVGSGRFPITPFVVGPSGQAGYQTIQSALNAANAAGGGMVFIQKGSYSENLVLYDNIQLFGDSEQGTFITGTHTPPLAGTLNFFRLNFISPTAIFSSNASGTTTIIGEDCTVNVTNGYTFNLPNWTGTIAVDNFGNAGTNDGFVNNTAGAFVAVFFSSMGSGSANPMILSGTTLITTANNSCPMNFNSNSNIIVDNCVFNNTVTFNGSSSGIFTNTCFATSSMQSIIFNSSSNISLLSCGISSTFNPAVGGTGTGSLKLNGVAFSDNTAISGNFATSPGSFIGGELRSGADIGGRSNFTSLTNANTTTIGAGTGTVKMSSANNANNSAWIKIYIGTTAYWIPAWTTNSP